MRLIGSDSPVVYINAAIWPAVAFIAIVVLVFVPNVSRTVGRVLGRLRRFQGFGIEFELTPDAKQSAQQSVADIVQNFRVLTNRAFILTGESLRIADLHAVFVEDHFRPTVLRSLDAVTQKEKNEAKHKLLSLRSTIYIPDVLSLGSLYQLLDYYPGGTGQGRTKSMRFGIVGQAWRLQKSVTSGTIPQDSEDLIREWGMSRQEAANSGNGRSSFSCVLLRNGDDLLGLMYFDAADAHAFVAGPSGTRKADLDAYTRRTDAFNRSLEQAAVDCGLVAKLEKLAERLVDRTPSFRIGE